MKKLLTSLKQKNEKLKMIEKVNDTRETEYQKLARAIGCDPTVTFIILHELTNFDDHSAKRHLDYVKRITGSCEQLLQFNYGMAQDFDVLTHIFSGASLLLHMLYKNRGANMEEIITVEPLDVQALHYARRQIRSRSFTFNSLTLHNIPPSGSLSPSPIAGQSGSLECGSAKLQFCPISSSGDFFMQLKAIVGKCFRLLLSLVAISLDLLLDEVILVENFSEKKRSELPSLQPVISLLRKTLLVFQVNLVHFSLSQQFFSEVFNRINNILMNSILERQQLCTETFGSYLKFQIESIQATADEMGKCGLVMLVCAYKASSKLLLYLLFQTRTI